MTKTRNNCNNKNRKILGIFCTIFREKWIIRNTTNTLKHAESDFSIVLVLFLQCGRIPKSLPASVSLWVIVRPSGRPEIPFLGDSPPALRGALRCASWPKWTASARRGGWPGPDLADPVSRTLPPSSITRLSEGYRTTSRTIAFFAAPPTRYTCSLIDSPVNMNVEERVGRLDFRTKEAETALRQLQTLIDIVQARLSEGDRANT